MSHAAARYVAKRGPRGASPSVFGPLDAKTGGQQVLHFVVIEAWPGNGYRGYRLKVSPASNVSPRPQEAL